MVATFTEQIEPQLTEAQKEHFNLPIGGEWAKESDE